jgi:hypothetical protein
MGRGVSVSVSRVMSGAVECHGAPGSEFMLSLHAQRRYKVVYFKYSVRESSR